MVCPIIPSAKQDSVTFKTSSNRTAYFVSLNIVVSIDVIGSMNSPATHVHVHVRGHLLTAKCS